ncbi:unnamed protein product, partial [Schistosoma margrebowiei]
CTNKHQVGSIVPECDTVKTAYDLCFQEFFPNFLKGYTFEKDPCETKLKIYQNCLREALKNTFNMDLNELDSIRTDAETIRKITILDTKSLDNFSNQNTVEQEKRLYSNSQG